MLRYRKIQLASILATTLLALSACSSNVQKDSNSNGESATFVVEPVSAEVSDLSTDSTFRGLTNARLYRFKACVKDVGVLQAISGATFQVLNEERVLSETVSDPSGCLFWSERIDFSPTEAETFLEANRLIRAVSVHKGQVKIPLALNPWRKDGDALRDLRTNARPERMRNAQSKASSTPTSSLRIDSVALEMILRPQSQLEADLRLSFDPMLRRISYDGKPLLEPIQEGKLAFRFQLVALMGNEATPLTSVISLEEVAIAASKVRIEKQVHLVQLPKREADLELHFEAKAIDAPAGIAPMQGRLSLGRFTGPTLSRSGVVRSENTPPFVSAPLAAKPEPGPAEQSQTFQVGKFRTERIEVIALDGLGKPRQLEFQLAFCVKNSLSLDPVLGESFRLTEAGESPEQKVSDTDSGCVRWKKRVNFDYTSAPEPIRSELLIEGMSGYYKNSSTKRVFYLLPWNSDSGSAALIDELFEGQPAKTIADEGSRPEIVLTDAAFSFKGRSFGIDPSLNLYSIRRYRFAVHPAIRRLSRNSGWLSPESITSGRFKARLLLETTDIDNPQVIDAKEIEVEAISGAVNFDADFRFDDLAMVMGRLRLTLELRPLDSSIKVTTMPASDTVSMLKDGNLSLVRRPLNLDDRISLAEARRARPTPLPVLEFAKAFQLEAVPADKPNFREAAEKVVSGNQAALKELCALFAKPPGMLDFFSPYSYCMKNPENFLAVARTQHLKKLHSYRLQAAPQSMSFTMSAGLSVSLSKSKSDSTSNGYSAGTDISAGGEVPLLNLVGIKIGVGVRAGTSWSRSFTRSTSESTSNSRSNSLSRNLTVDQANFEIQADVENCIVVSTKENPAKSKRYFHCASAPVKQQFTESYYFFYDSISSSAIQDDSNSSSERPFLSLLRGSSRFQDYLKTLQNKNLVMVTDSTPMIPQDPATAGEPARFDGLFPGLLEPKK